MSEATPDTSAEPTAENDAAMEEGQATDAVAADSGDAASNGGGTTPPSELGRLPAYARSLLKISVPVTAVLATQRKPIKEIVELVPGSIIKFDKSCDEPAVLAIGDHQVATGEVVKVGERFGLRIAGMILPPEHFQPARPAAGS